MAKREKLVDRLLSVPENLAWDELITILSYLGFKEAKKGKTGGLRRKFIDAKNNIVSFSHNLDLGKIVREYAISQLIEYLKEKGKIKDE